MILTEDDEKMIHLWRVPIIFLIIRSAVPVQKIQVNAIVDRAHYFLS